MRITINKILSICWIAVCSFVLIYMRDLSFSHVWVAPAVTALWTVLLYLPSHIGSDHMERIKKINDKIWDTVDDTLSEREFFYHLWGIGLLVFLSAYIAYFPGIFGYDAAAQFAMFMGKGAFNSAQQPLLHTLLIGCVVSAGEKLTGSYQTGFAALVFLQGIAVTNCTAQIAVFLKRRRVSLPVISLGMLWIVLNPYIQILNCNITKDVLFGVFCIDFILAFLHLLEKEKIDVWDILRMTFTGILLCLFRNGFVLPLLFIAGVTFLMGVRKKEIYLSFAVICIFAECFSFTADHAFGIKKEPLREYLSVPIQQMASVLYEDENHRERVNLTYEERVGLKELLPDEEILGDGFDWHSVDAPKATFREDLLKLHPAKYFKIYVHVGMKNREIYRDAWIYLIHPYFNMNRNEDKALMLYDFLPLFFEEGELDINSSPRYLLGYRSYLDNAARGEVPFLHDPALCLFVLGLLVGRVIAGRERDTFLGILLLLIYFVGIMLGPVALMRYTYPLMLSFPLVFGLLTRGNNIIHTGTI